jgi:hypothetical protein
MSSASLSTNNPRPKLGAREHSRTTIDAICRAVAVVAIALFVGCGKPDYQLDTAPVRGTVTLDGEPLPSGYVVVPTMRGRMATGEIQPDGTYEMTTYSPGDGVQVGSQRVVVTPVPPDQKAEKRVPIPQRYQQAGTSGFTIDVKPGEDHVLDLMLTTEEQKP